MDLKPVFELAEFTLLFLSAYWGLKVSTETLTYVRVSGPLLLLPLAVAVVFREAGFLASFLLLFAFFLLKRNGLGLSLVASIFAFMVFLVGAMASALALGVIGTYLHVPGYEIHGTLQELLHRAVMK
ncbi:hypothetical protein [Thermococcus henrietii]|uniref:hypothetical protein n=1 Tax=Thermococcus henrietii TaxID=2016361 RepID=UPI000C06B323|nr:hypothetical protein [Thermococcus henrietii]